MTKEQTKQLQIDLNNKYRLTPGYTPLVVDGILGSKTKSAQLKSEMRNDPYFNQYSDAQKDAIIGGMITGDWTKVQGVGGKPFDNTTATKAFEDNMTVLDPVYAAEKQKETLDTQDVLASKTDSYAEAERKARENFQTEKTALDQNAADQGVLFSGGRIQKENNLKNTYDAEEKARRNALSRDINTTGRDYAYKYGTPAANSLSSYYNVSGNTYNPNIATGGAAKTSLSNMYNQGGANFYGTNVAKQKAEAATRAYGQLKNLTNKSVVGGYKNKL